MSATSSGGSFAGSTPVQVSSGWAYVVRPPSWPVGSTPGQRGGVRVASPAQQVHVVFVAEPGAERIFCLGGRTESGQPAPCTVTVETIDPPGTPVRSTDV